MPEVVREPSANTVHASPTAMRAFPSPQRGLIIAAVAALFMTFVGALGTGGYPVWLSLSYWLVVMEVGALIGIGVSGTVVRWGRLAQRPVVEGVVIAFLIAVPLSSVVTVATMLMLGQRGIGLIQFLIIALVVFIVSCVMTAINYAVTPAAVDSPPAAAPTANDQIGSPNGPVDDAAGPLPDLFGQRLPLRFRQSRLLAIEAEDHYLRVHTDAGSTLVLMRLADAVAELGDRPGARTHRSWWVARDAVVGVQSVEGRTSLLLPNDLVAPVSRSNRTALAAAGWLDR